MEIDFDSKEPIADYISVPAGSYLCRITEVRTGETRAGDARWSIRLTVAEGQHVGKQAAWDSIVFSVRGRARARTILHSLGLPTSGRVDIEPADIEGRSALVEVRPTEYESPSGQVVRRNEVPYNGYRRSDPSGAEASAAAYPQTEAAPATAENGTRSSEQTSADVIPF